MKNVLCNFVDILRLIVDLISVRFSFFCLFYLFIASSKYCCFPRVVVVIVVFCYYYIVYIFFPLSWVDFIYCLFLLWFFFVSDRSRSNRWTHSFDRWIACFYFLDRYLDRQTDGLTNRSRDRLLYVFCSVFLLAAGPVWPVPHVAFYTLCTYTKDGWTYGWVSIDPSISYLYNVSHLIPSHLSIHPSIHGLLVDYSKTIE